MSRKEHDKKRGIKLEKLTHFSRKKPDFDELNHIMSQIESESDRGCALISAALLENLLEMTLDCHFADCGDSFRKSLYEGADAPLGTFSSKIRMGRALGIYDERTQKNWKSSKM